MAIRCYIPTTLSALRSGLGAVHAVAPNSAGRDSGGEELEAQEFDALCIAAALAAAQSFDSTADGQSKDVLEAPVRAVAAYDAPTSTAAEQLTSGFDLLSIDEVDPTSIVSFHVDEPHVWEAAVTIAAEGGREAAEDHLGDSDLLWYDVTELDQLLEERG